MPVARGRSAGGRASFGLALILFGLAPARVGPQDLASLIAPQHGVGERWREHVIASPFGMIQPATFTFPQPVGTGNSTPIGFQLASLGPDITGALGSPAIFDPPDEPMEFPFIDRRLKGDRLVPPGSEPDEPAALKIPPGAQPTARPGPEQPPQPAGKDKLASVPPVAGDGPDAATPLVPFTISRPDTIAADDQPAETAPGPAGAQAEPTEADLDASEPDTATATLDDDVSPAIRTARIYFGTRPLGGMTETLQPWGPGQEPIFEDALPTPGPHGKIVSAPRPGQVPTLDDARRTLGPHGKIVSAPQPDGTPADAGGGQTIAGKGQVTGAGHRPKSPAERLGLAGKSRARAEKCLADAVYFEARGESVRGQIAVAQVVMNRVFSGYYPDNVCGVVYQNASHHLACQFTFACDGIPNRITEPDAWRRAKRIARNTLDGKYWLNDVGKATHYHAYWVHPWWVHEMRKLDRIGAHTFYRPRRWGDGSDEPAWGDAAATRLATKRL